MPAIRILGPGDAAVLDHVAEGVFDNAVYPRWTAEFLADSRQRIAVDDGRVVGMESAVHYVHPDKPPELWINEVGVALTYRGLGIGRRLLDALLAGSGRGGWQTW
jgi:aminoglycoside 6'-N-acetyltransferase I